MANTKRPRLQQIQNPQTSQVAQTAVDLAKFLGVHADQRSIELHSFIGISFGQIRHVFGSPSHKLHRVGADFRHHESPNATSGYQNRPILQGQLL